MTHASQPVQAIPVAATAPVVPVAPVTAREAAALVSRMRVEARLPRIVIVGVALGLVSGVVTIWPFVKSDAFVVESLVATHQMRFMGWFGILMPILLVGLLLLLAFYSLRLHVQSGPSTPASVEDNLRKIRSILAACMFASLGAVIAVAVRRSYSRGLDGMSDVGLIGLYSTCCLACGLIVGDVRKGLGEFESRTERQRRRIARGFSVEFKPSSSMATITPATSMPVAVLPITEDVVAAPVPAVPLATPAILPAASESAGTQGERDLRTILHLLAAVGVGVYVLRAPHTVRAIEEILELFQSSTRLITRWAATPSGQSGPGFEATMLRYFANVGLGVCGLAWMAWGVIVLCYGARFRAAILVVSLISLVCLLTLSGVALVAHDPFVMNMGGMQRNTLELEDVFPRPAEFAHCIMMCVVLTRPRVKDLFTHGSEAGEGT